MTAIDPNIRETPEQPQAATAACTKLHALSKIDRRRIQFLDVLRGIAALMVVLQHAVESASPGFAHWTNEYLNFGEIGVVVFFIVSGFIIPVSLEKYNSLPRFWMGRIFRLWPPYIVSLAAAIAIYPFVHELPAFYQAHPVDFILGNLTMFEEYLRIPFAIGAYWASFSLELVFYLLCSVLFLFGSLKNRCGWSCRLLVYCWHNAALPWRFISHYRPDA